MRKTFLALAAVCGLGLFSTAQAAPIPAGAAAPDAATQQVTKVATVVVRTGRPVVRRHFRRPVCTVTVRRMRTPHGWVTRRIRRCR